MSLLKIKPFIIDDTTASDAYVKANGAFGTANSAALYANAAFTAANNASDSWVRNQANGAFIQANAAFNAANNASDSWVRNQANLAFGTANSGSSYANSAFIRANNSLNVQSGGTITGNVTIAGNFNPSTNVTYSLGSSTARWKDLYLSGNTIDLGGALIKNDANTGSFIFVPLASANTPNPTALFISSTGSITTVQTTGGVITDANLTLAAANTANSAPADVSINLAFAKANAAFIQANSAYNAANNASDSWVRNQANLAFGTANSGSSYANSAFTAANTATNNAAGASLYANAAFLQANTADSKAVTAGSYANSAFTVANNALPSSGFLANTILFVNLTGNVSNTSSLQFFNSNNTLVVSNIITPNIYGTQANTSIVANGFTTLFDTTGKTTFPNLIQFADGTTQNTAAPSSGSITTVGSYANSAYTASNSAGSYANSSFGTANSAALYANGAFTQSNASYGQANSAASYANSAFTKANNAVPASGGTVSGSLTVTQDVSIQGNLSVLGTSTSINTASFTVNDSLLILGLGNYTSDLLDIGFASHYNAGTNAHTGLIRDSDTKTWTFFEGYTPEVSTNNNIVISDPSFAYANVRARTVTGNLIANTVTVNGYDLFTYTTNAYTQANTGVTNAATADGKAVTAGSYANSAYTQANTATTNAATADGKAVTAGSYANSAFGTANSAASYANAAFAQANAAYAKANTGGGGASGITYTAANTAPTSPKVGDQWYIISSDILYQYINDGTSNNWVDITSPTMTSAAATGASAASIVGYNLVFGG
jgi:hypothetical protein